VIQIAAHIGQIDQAALEHHRERRFATKVAVSLAWPGVGLIFGGKQDAQRLLDSHDIGNPFQRITRQYRPLAFAPFVERRARRLA
jgi:hypothetical protein